MVLIENNMYVENKYKLNGLKNNSNGLKWVESSSNGSKMIGSSLEELTNPVRSIKHLIQLLIF